VFLQWSLTGILEDEPIYKKEQLSLNFSVRPTHFPVASMDSIDCSFTSETVKQCAKCGRDFPPTDLVPVEFKLREDGQANEKPVKKVKLLCQACREYYRSKTVMQKSTSICKTLFPALFNNDL